MVQALNLDYFLDHCVLSPMHVRILQDNDALNIPGSTVLFDNDRLGPSLDSKHKEPGRPMQAPVQFITGFRRMPTPLPWPHFSGERNLQQFSECTRPRDTSPVAGLTLSA